MAPRIPQQDIEKYFKLEKDTATCKMCAHVLKSDRIYNLKAHYKNVHKIFPAELEPTKKEYVQELKMRLARKYTRRGRALTIELTSKQLFRSYIGLVSEDGLPFDVLDSENMRSIFNPICRGLSDKCGKEICLNSSNCKKALSLVADKVRNGIQDFINERLLSIQIDQATGNVFEVSARFIADGVIEFRTLGVLALIGAYEDSSLDLAKQIMDTLIKFKINMVQVVSITFDNGSRNIGNATTCEEQYSGRDESSGDVYLKSIERFQSFNEIRLGDVKVCRYASHTARLCALDIIKEDEIRNYLLKCRNLTKHIRNPANGFREIFELQVLTMPQLDCPTKWASTYDMILALKDAKDALMYVEAVKWESTDGNFDLTESFWDFVEAYIVAFEPLQRTLLIFQKAQLHYSDFYAEWLKCKLCTGVLLPNDTVTWQHKIISSLLASMERWTNKLLGDENLVSCLYLDPRFKHTLSAAQSAKAIAYLKRSYEKIKSTNMHLTQVVSATIKPCSTTASESRVFADKATQYLNDYLTKNFMSKTDESFHVYAKIENLQLPFLKVDTDVIQFWKEKQHTDPELYALSNICFAIPATQMSNEETMSSLKCLLSDNRNSQETLANILLVKSNPSILDEAIDTLTLFEDLD